MTRPVVAYRWCGVAVLRASTDPGGWDLPDVDLCGDRAMERGLAWLSDLWAHAEVRAAVTYASPALSRRVDDVIAGRHGDRHTVRRVVLSVASYLLRWRGRATPFGLFAGVGVARIGGGAKVRWGREHRVVTRSDAGWLGGVLAGLQRNGQLLERLSVVVTDAASVRGDRIVVPGRAADDGGGGLAPIEVSVRNSRPVQAALEAAREPVNYRVLRDLLLRRFPAAAGEQVDRMLVGLLDQGILISNLDAPMTCWDAFGHVRTVLGSVNADSIPEVAGTVRELFAIQQELTAGPVGRTLSLAVAGRMRALSDASDVLIVDTVLDADVQIPHQVAREAADAVAMLLRLSSYPFGYPIWRDYHARFRARYGTGALVPVLDLVADSGLGFPADYLGSGHGRAARKVSERDETLLPLIQRAMVDGSGEIVVTDQVVEDLTPADRTGLVHLPDRVEVSVEIRAASVDELARGHFELTITGTPRPGSSMAGRHAHLLPQGARDLLSASYAASAPDAVAAQLSFAPRARRNENVARTGQLLPQVIPIAEQHQSGKPVIPVGDLAVTADERRFYLIQASTGRLVEPRVTHALEPRTHTPPLARFLSDISTARAAVYRAFDFGAASRLPFLPRVRYRRTILSPARWLLTARDLPGRDAPMVGWEAGLEAWRARWRVPERLAMVDHDRRQPLDLGHRLHRQLLRTRLERAGHLELRETASSDELGWLGHAHEVVIPLRWDGPTLTPPTFATSPSRLVTADAGHLPGHSKVLCAQIYGHPARFDEILVEHLPTLIGSVGAGDGDWWFRRHRRLRHPETDQYLAVCLRLSDPDAYGPAAQHVAAWAEGLRRARLIAHLSLTTYEPQTGRYGTGPALDRAQDVFAADSAAALAQITLTLHGGTPPQALTAASFVDLAKHFIGSAQTGSDWLIRELHREHGRLEPTLRQQTLDLVAPGGAGATLRSLPGAEEVIAAWRQRAATLAAYREVLSPQRDPLTVLPALLHLHHIRAVGVDPESERVTGRLARACALRDTAHRTAPQ
ncbi:MAG TPA: lantibiotic dehydratase [Pseudonocardiaceae bacterium]